MHEGGLRLRHQPRFLTYLRYLGLVGWMLGALDAGCRCIPELDFYNALSRIYVALSRGTVHPGTVL